MRLKTIPRQRKRNNSHEPTKNVSRGHDIQSTNFTQDVNKEFMDIKEYGRKLKNLEKPVAKRYEVPGTWVKSDPVKFGTGRYVEEAGLFNHTKSSVNDTLEAVNLCIRNSSRSDVKKETISGSSAPAEGSTNSCNKFAGSLLYQIMTDPTFVENIKNNRVIKKLTCEFCKKKFANDDELQDHLESRANKFDRITCCACGKTFGQKRYLRYHQRCHIMVNKFTCEICTKKYSRMDNLTRHKAYHTNPDKYPCEICKKTFSRRDLMNKHLRSHEVKKNNCDICKRVFNDSAEMKAHKIALHTANNRN